MLGFIGSFAQSSDFGLADNGDFTRLMQGIVSRPEAVSINAPPSNTPAYDLRFYRYWIPDWHIELDPGAFASTSELLWLPAVFVARIANGTTVALPVVGATLEAVLAVLYCTLLLQVVDDAVLLAIFGAGFGLMLTTSDYAAYNNSFYSEGASGVFYVVFLLALAALVAHPSKRRWLGYFLAAAALSASKLQNSYLFVFAFVPAAYVLRRVNRLNAERFTFVCALGLIVSAPPVINLWHQSNDLKLLRFNDYDRVYDGMLTFSDDPARALAAVGGGDPACVGTIVFMPVGERCANAYPHSFSRASAFRLLAREPLIVPRMIGFAADSMQDISLEYLGKYKNGDPRAVPLPVSGPSSWTSSNNRDYYSQYVPPPANAWSYAKYLLFPRSAALFLYIAAAGVVFFVLRGGRYSAQIQYCGLFSLAVCLSQLVVDIFGDGREEIIKHLYLANVAFDGSLILLVAALTIVVRQLIDRRRIPPALADTRDTSRERRLPG